MADTNHSHVGSAPVEGDGISYGGIVWFVVILAATVLVSQGLMVFAFKFMVHEADVSDTARSPLATPANQLPPAPNLLYERSDSPEQNEPGNLARFRRLEDQKLHTYEWIDQTAGTVRIPIDRAKALVLERGLPVRSASTSAPPAAAKAAPSKADK
jgi:hypothetical protein